MSSLIAGVSLVPAELLSALLQGLPSQHRRLLTIDTPMPGSPFVVERVRGMEGINLLGAFEIDCLSASAHLDLTPLIGEEITLRVGCADGTLRPWHGIVMQAAALGSDGGTARYRLSAQSWLRVLQHRRDSFIYQGLNALEIVADVFKDYEIAHRRAEVTETPVQSRPSRRCAARSLRRSGAPSIRWA